MNKFSMLMCGFVVGMMGCAPCETTQSGISAGDTEISAGDTVSDNPDPGDGCGLNCTLGDPGGCPKGWHCDMNCKCCKEDPK